MKLSKKARVWTKKALDIWVILMMLLQPVSMPGVMVAIAQDATSAEVVESTPADSVQTQPAEVVAPVVEKAEPAVAPTPVVEPTPAPVEPVVTPTEQPAPAEPAVAETLKDTSPKVLALNAPNVIVWEDFPTVSKAVVVAVR